jgi:hypothetical protein
MHALPLLLSLKDLDPIVFNYAQSSTTIILAGQPQCPGYYISERQHGVLGNKISQLQPENGSSIPLLVSQLLSPCHGSKESPAKRSYKSQGRRTPIILRKRSFVAVYTLYYPLCTRLLESSDLLVAPCSSSTFSRENTPCGNFFAKHYIRRLHMARTKTSRPSDGIPGFDLVVPTVWVRDPDPLPTSPADTSSSARTPSHVFIFPWTNARSRDVAKYTNKYLRLFPGACLVVITTSLKDLCFRSSLQKQARLQGFLDHLLGDSEHDNVRILMHVFSEGGSNKAVELAEAHTKRTGRRLPVLAICLDSTPGLPRYLRLCNALEKSLLPHPLLKQMGFVVGSCALGAIWILFRVFRDYEDNPISRTRRQLLDPSQFDHCAPRCYIYSKADALVAWQDIQDHIAASLELDIPVTQCVFSNSKHCMHARDEQETYWGLVLQTWRKVAASNLDIEKI